MAASANNGEQKTSDDQRTVADDTKAPCLSMYGEGTRGEMWKLVGEFSVLNRKKCRHLYAKAGKRKDLALFYDEGKFYAMEAWCSHMGGPLYLGDLEDYKGSCHVMCPWHSYMFDLATGKNEIGLHQEVHEVKVEMGNVYVKYHSELSLTPYDEKTGSS